ncbi:MAG: hypothetical protein ACKO8T_08900, partial [Actinomycetota bacterium]
MTGLITSSTSGNDWGWVRWNRLRWDFVNVLELASHHPDDVPMTGCDVLECCFALRELLDDLGLRLEEPTNGRTQFAFLEELEDFVTTDMRDGLLMISHFYAQRAMALPNPFEGMMEIPQAIGEIYHADHFQGIARAASDEEIDLDLIREIFYAIATVALPDSFLQQVWSESNETGRGEAIYRQFRAAFEENGLVAPNLSTEIIDDLRRGSLGFATPFFPGTWDWIGLYMLEMGREDGSSSLQDYWETLPTIPWAFGYTERGNGYGLAMCFMARVTGSILVSQQTWMSLMDPSAADTAEWNACALAFNKYLAPLLTFRVDDAPAMVVFSS